MTTDNSFFNNTIMLLRQYIPISDDIIKSTKKLSQVSKQFHIDRSIIIYSVKRNEYVLLCNMLSYFSGHGFFYCSSFLNSYPSIPCPLKNIYTSLVKMVHEGLKNTDKGDAIFKKILGFCLKQTDERMFIYYINLFTIAAISVPGFISEFIPILHGYPSRLSWHDFTEWANRGLDILTSGNREEGVEFFRMKSAESRKILNLSHVTLQDMEKVLNIYSASIIKRDLSVKSSESFYYSTDEILTDGKVLYMPPVVGFFKDPEKNKRIYTVMTASAAALIEYGTYKFDFTGSDLKKEISIRYGLRLPPVLESVREQYRGKAEKIKELPTGEIEAVFRNKKRVFLLESEHEKFYYSFPTPHFARFLFTLIENLRIQYLLCQKYSGIYDDFFLLNTYVKYTAEQKNNINEPSDFREKELEHSLKWLITGSLDMNIFLSEDRIENNPFFNQLSAEVRKVLSASATTSDSADVTYSIYNLFYDSLPLVQYCSKKDISIFFSSLFRPVIAAEFVYNNSPELMMHTPWKHPESEKNRNNDLRLLDFASFKSQDRKYTELKQSLSTKPVRIFRYPEFDYNMGTYHENHCTVFELTGDSLNTGYCRRVIQNHRKIYTVLKKRFVYLSSDEVSISRKWFDGDDIQIDDALDYITDLKKGSVPDEKIYFKKIKTERDLAVALLIDASSSTDEIINNKKIIDIEKESVIILSSVLNTIGDTFGIFTFFSLGKDRVYFNVIKNFNETWNDTTQGRIEKFEPYASNRDGCAIRHACSRLAEQPCKTKLLIILSDGIPADAQYGSDSVSDVSLYGIEDTRKAVAECRLKGIRPYCVTIDSEAGSYVEHIYGNYGYCIINNVSLLPMKLSKLYMKLTR